MATIGLTHYLVLSGIVFTIGLYGALAKRNAVIILMSIELMFNAVNIAFVGLSRFSPVPPGGAPLDLTGQVFALFVITVAAAEAAIALAIILTVYRLRKTVSIDDLNLLKW
ncbi:MAG: NADH-quinone oxidoreductase subunit NuoK [Chloroflexota bacterium]|nr:MAG: NADH-quinone oxidoreductase subunit NuoK [Chloroflexota bacterium]